MDRQYERVKRGSRIFFAHRLGVSAPAVAMVGYTALVGRRRAGRLDIRWALCAGIVFLNAVRIGRCGVYGVL